MAKKTPEVSPQMQPQESREERAARRSRDRREKQGFCKFVARSRCFVEGTMLEGPEQTITLSPAAAYRQRRNKNLQLIEGAIPKPPEDIEEPKKKDQPSPEYLDWLEDLEEGDITVGPAPQDFKLVKQAGA